MVVSQSNLYFYNLSNDYGQMTKDFNLVVGRWSLERGDFASLPPLRQQIKYQLVKYQLVKYQVASALSFSAFSASLR